MICSCINSNQSLNFFAQIWSLDWDWWIRRPLITVLNWNVVFCFSIFILCFPISSVFVWNIGTTVSTQLKRTKFRISGRYFRDVDHLSIIKIRVHHFGRVAWIKLDNIVEIYVPKVSSLAIACYSNYHFGILFWLCFLVFFLLACLDCSTILLNVSLTLDELSKENLSGLGLEHELMNMHERLDQMKHPNQPIYF